MFGVKLQFSSLCLCLVLSGITLGLGQVISVTEDSDVVLPCSLSTKENIEFKLFDWKKPAQKDQPRKEVFFYDAGVHYNNGHPGQSEEFKGRVFFSQKELKQGNASITIRNTTVTDRGIYTCVFPRLQPPQRFQIKLIVALILKVREIAGASPKPSVTILDHPEGGALLLQCFVQGAYPKPELQWKDNAGKNLTAAEPQVTERKEKDATRYDVTLQITVTKTDYYSCVATQHEIYHQITSDKIYASPKEKLIWLIGGLFLGSVLSALVVVVWFKRHQIMRTCREKVKLVRAEEGKTVVLPCSVKENIESNHFRWTKDAQENELPKEVFLYYKGNHYNNSSGGQSEEFKERVKHIQTELKDGNASIIITNIKRADTGIYTCEFPLLEPPQRFLIGLIVDGQGEDEDDDGATELSPLSV
ncbi:CD276 antigen homolog isoform X2 [Centropristis striata]|uniref:CD276 antigen homolog isoform X2 n=1 Tax=Centropristis striata TaxID=184440 RepID=UPI0027E0B77C|nr:CD276 antigen homolog isoform X2 [Centropristis striata]